jgi:hypothetical protein
MPVEYGEMPLMFDDDFLIKLWSGQVNMTPETLLNKICYNESARLDL